MISPDTGFPPSPEEIQEDKRNGNGYWAYTPTPASPLSEALPALRDYGEFTEIPDIVDGLLYNKAVLVSGAPGSGKSHLVRDIQTGCVLNNIPAFCLTMHVNSGKGQGIANIQPALNEFRDKVRETGGGLVILDNLDILGYRGHSRSRTKATEYAQDARELVEDLLSDRDVVVLATSHDDEWREGKWAWDDPVIDEPAQAVLEAFPSRFVFEGKMALEGLAHLLRGRNLRRDASHEQISLGQAAQIMRWLAERNRANFFHANHLPVATFMEDPETAIAEIDHGRAVRRGKA